MIDSEGHNDWDRMMIDFINSPYLEDPQIDVPKLIDIFVNEYPREKPKYNKILERDLINRVEWLKLLGYDLRRGF